MLAGLKGQAITLVMIIGWRIAVTYSKVRAKGGNYRHKIITQHES